MKKTLILSFVAMSAVSAGVNATVICSAPTTSGNGTAITAGTNFVKVDFTPKCSANVHMAHSENQVAVGVASGSSKGKNVFSGSTNGGGVKPSGSCTSGCNNTSDVTQGVADTARDAS